MQQSLFLSLFFSFCLCFATFTVIALFLFLSSLVQLTAPHSRSTYLIWLSMLFTEEKWFLFFGSISIIHPLVSFPPSLLLPFLPHCLLLSSKSTRLVLLCLNSTPASPWSSFSLLSSPPLFSPLFSEWIILLIRTLSHVAIFTSLDYAHSSPSFLSSFPPFPFLP